MVIVVKQIKSVVILSLVGAVLACCSLDRGHPTKDEVQQADLCTCVDTEACVAITEFVTVTGVFCDVGWLGSTANCSINFVPRAGSNWQSSIKSPIQSVLNRKSRNNWCFQKTSVE